ncbi:TraR/DksA family transcriptional regulator [Nitriliruptoraceae bacterium ZYF776]|nr:TraR/DksA family transcriptional regulator [Profundirhabdus halotolerans]
MSEADAEVARAIADRRGRTEERVRALRRDFATIVEQSSDASRDDEHDPEGATIAFERAQVTALLRDAEAQLDALDAASARLADGEVDRCEACDGPIGTERLLARPTVRTCARCQAARER